MGVGGRADQHRVHFRMTYDSHGIIGYEWNTEVLCKRTPRFGGAHGCHHRSIIEMPVNVLQMDAPNAPDAEESESDHDL